MEATLRANFYNVNAPLGEVIKEFVSGDALIVTDYESVNVVRAIRKRPSAKEKSLILIVSEPHTEEFSIELAKQLAWFKLAGIQPYRVRVSGHYLPYEYRELLQALKPKKLIPIHTLSPKTMLSMFR